MNLGLGKLTQTLKKDKIGQLIGAGLTDQVVGKATEYGDLFGMIMGSIEKLGENPHFPNINEVVDALMHRTESKIFKPAIKIAVIGYLLNELKLHPTLTKWGNVGSKLGVNVAIGSALITLWNYSTVFGSATSPAVSGGGHSSGGNSETWRYQT